MENRRRDGRGPRGKSNPQGRDPHQQPLTNESHPSRSGAGKRRSGGPPRQEPRRPNPQFDDERQPLTSENPHNSPQRGGYRSDRPAPPRDDRRRTGPGSDRPRQGGSGRPQGRRSDGRPGPGPGRNDGRRPDGRPARPDGRAARPDGRAARPDGRPPRSDGRHARPEGRPRPDRPQGAGNRQYDGSRQPLTSENPSAPRARGRARPGGGYKKRTGGSAPPPARRRTDGKELRTKVYTSDTFLYKENLDEQKPTERKMRSRRKKPSGDSSKPE